MRDDIYCVAIGKSCPWLYFFAKEYETFRPHGGMPRTIDKWFIRFTKKPKGPKLGPFR